MASKKKEMQNFIFKKKKITDLEEKENPIKKKKAEVQKIEWKL